MEKGYEEMGWIGPEQPVLYVPSQRNASPSEQELHEPVLPWTVKSSSDVSSTLSLRTLSCLSALARRAASCFSRRSARPQVQSAQARRFFPGWGRHSGAIRARLARLSKKKRPPGERRCEKTYAGESAGTSRRLRATRPHR